MTTVAFLMGMHRSGTSLLAQVVHRLGVHLGPSEDLLPPTEDNPDGYWEDNRVVQLDDQLLGFLGGWWNTPPVLAQDWEYDWQLEPFRVWGAQLMGERLRRPGPSAVKDPRLSILLPFWRTVVDVGPTVLGVRRPQEVAASLARRDGMTVAEACDLWVRYTTDAIAADPTTLVVRYDDWFEAPARTVVRVSSHLGLGEPSPERCDAALTAIRGELRRSPPATPTDDADAEALHRAGSVYDALVG